MTAFQKPPTLQTDSFKEWLRINILSRYISNISRNEKTLDLACGWGFSFSINPNFWGVEIDDDCVNYCQQKGYKVTKGNLLTSLPFPDEFFDNAFTQDVLEHFEFQEVDLIFQNVYKVLRPGGKFMNVTPNRKGYDYGFVINAGHKHFIVPEEIKQVAQRNGFKYLGSYSAPVPEFMNSWFTHAKYVTLCQKI
jgi:cyclopropane fatty-acyl-phospholipid synthase-like methyltransferase